MTRAPRLVLLALVAVLFATAPAVAHVSEQPTLLTSHAPAAAPLTLPSLTESIGAATPPPALPWSLAIACAALALATVWRPRRVLALVLVLLAGLGAFEAGVHSTHHLGQRDDGRHCVVAGVSAQLSADLVATTTDAAPVTLVRLLVTPSLTPAPVARVVAPDAGRAPPVLSA